MKFPPFLCNKGKVVISMLSQKITNFKTMANGDKYDSHHDETFNPITGEVVETKTIYDYLLEQRLI